MISHYANDLLTTYTADLATLEPLSEEQQQALLAAAAQQGSSLDQQTHNRLLEDSLALAHRLTIKHCPPTYAHLLPDMIGDVNLALVRAAERFDPREPEGNLRAYLCSFIEGSVRTTINRRRSIRIPEYRVREALRQEQPELLNQWTAKSIEAYMQWLDLEGKEPAMFPLLPTEALPEPDPAQRTLIADWLSHLPARDEQIVRLYYGLTEGDERSYSISEIARTLGIGDDATYATVERSHLRLKKLAEGTACFREHKGRQVVKGVVPGGTQPLPVLTPEQENRLQQATHDLCAQGKTVSMRTLSKASGLSYRHARVFLNQSRQELPEEVLPWTDARRKKRERERLERVRQVYEQFLAEGRPLIRKQLAQEAQVNIHVVWAFMRTCRQEREESATSEACK
jgi:RNA polymerase sigma factor (sigma-70 family)